jgi:phosphotransacetylase
MDWSQVLAIVASTIGSTYGFFLIIREDIKAIKEDISLTKSIHREDVQRMDDKWERLFERMDKKLERMDDKWEHLLSGSK